MRAILLDDNKYDKKSSGIDDSATENSIPGDTIKITANRCASQRDRKGGISGA